MIYLCAVLGEIPDREAALQQSHAALKPAGQLSVTEIFPDPHDQSRSTVQRRVETSGFRLRDYFTANFVKSASA